MAMFSWSSLGPCRSPDCSMKGSCGTFYPVSRLDLLNAVDAAEALGLKCICSCFGIQHIIVAVDGHPVRPPTAEPSASRPAAGSSTVPPPSSNTSAPPPFSSFSEAINSRAQRQQGAPESATSKKEQQQSGLKSHIFEFAFDPSKASQTKSWTKLSERPQKRKPSSANPPGEPLSKTAKSGPKLVSFTMVLVENPAQVEASQYFMPSPIKMQSLYRAGNIQIIEVLPTITPEGLDLVVTSAFANHPEVLKNRISMHKWRSLSKVSISRGAHSLLKPHREAGEVTFQDFEWSAETHRQAKRFKRCVYISLARWCSPIPLDIDDPIDVDSLCQP
ncbi:hypothetical protein R3P38DRAFT_3575997 [Favolaschia claudopus]|uniref:Uncharacterized protein n=1 Tax=Favolaschia claudopus TaxID=2862362 RepID=A0AAW0AKP5_9AGAR